MPAQSGTTAQLGAAPLRVAFHAELLPAAALRPALFAATLSAVAHLHAQFAACQSAVAQATHATHAKWYHAVAVPLRSAALCATCLPAAALLQRDAVPHATFPLAAAQRHASPL